MTSPTRPPLGPAHTRRVLPRFLPQRRRELIDSGRETRWALTRDYVQVARGLVVPRRLLSGQYGGYPADAVTRARAHVMNNPDGILAEWGAAAVHGLWTDWPDSAPTVLLAARGGKDNSTTALAEQSPLRPVFRRIRPTTRAQVVRPDPQMPSMKVVDPATTAVQCLWSILSGRHRWKHRTLPGIPDRIYRAVQFVDAFTQCCRLTHDDIRHAGAGRIDARTLDTVLSLSDYGAQSPMETALRLTVLPLLPPGFRWSSQVESDADGATLPGGTVPDLACVELRIALYYDGGHHDSLEQRETDLRLTRSMMDAGWEVCRFTRHGIRSTAGVRRDVSAAVQRAVERWAGD